MQYRLSTFFLVFVVLWSSLGVFGVGAIVVFPLTVGLAVLVHRVKALWIGGIAAVAVLGFMLLFPLLVPAMASVRPVARRMQCANNMKQLALALHSYRQAHGCFPPAYVADKNGKPMHSWRVLILPYLELESLYKQYDFNEPWDGPNNKKLLADCPRAFACPSDMVANGQVTSETSYVAVVGANAAWQGDKPQTVGNFGDSSFQTIMLVEATDAGIQWTEPRDLSLDAAQTPSTPTPRVRVLSRHGCVKDFFFTYPRTGANVAMADASVRYLPPDALTPKVLPELLRVGGCTDENTKNLAANGNDYFQTNWDNIAALAVWLVSVAWLFHRAVRSRRKAAENECADAGNQG
ncbi:MAG: DUF1559 domain-containing protein [Planctomycetaceae bacterium]|nr:DUF1559 domain-containing protein [Planctomycetaceae bacterium]